MTIPYRGGYAVKQEDGDGGTVWHVYGNASPESYLRTVPDWRGQPLER